MKNQEVIPIVGLKLTLSGGLKNYRGLFEAKAVVDSLMFWKKEGTSVRSKFWSSPSFGPLFPLDGDQATMRR